MDKSQAINSFWNSFGIPAFDQYTVPEDVSMPYITFEASTDSVNSNIPMTASLWYRDSSWREISQMVDTISARISYSFYITAITGGYMVVRRGEVFAQRMNDPDDPDVRRILISVIVEFLTEN